MEKFNCFQILVSAVDIRHPFSFVLSIIKIEHGSHRIHTDTINVILFCPEQCVCDQEVLDFRTTVIVDQCAPVRMGTFSRIEVLVQAGSVKGSQSKRITRKMCRYPVQNHADALCMHIVHEIHEIFRCAVTTGRCIVSGHLIAPGTVKRVLHNRHQLNMRIAHLFYIVRKHHSQFTIIVKLPAVLRLAE